MKIKHIDEKVAKEIVKPYLNEIQFQRFFVDMGYTGGGITIKMVNSEICHLGMLSNLSGEGKAKYKISQENSRLILGKLKDYLNKANANNRPKILNVFLAKEKIAYEGIHVWIVVAENETEVKEVLKEYDFQRSINFFDLDITRLCTTTDYKESQVIQATH